jgi:hypothetical protein
MTSTEVTPAVLTCTNCGVVLGICAFCERGQCPEGICYRCLRIGLGESMAEPHVHGG